MSFQRISDLCPFYITSVRIESLNYVRARCGLAPIGQSDIAGAGGCEKMQTENSLEVCPRSGNKCGCELLEDEAAPTLL